jgi:prepilin-type N-terminal cleavage/methylation domain-containing protein
MRRNNARECGFTLAEVIMVTVVIATIAAVVIPQALEGSDVQSVSAARTMAADLEYARDLAISLATPITVTFDTAHDSYRLTNASRDIIHPITKAPAYVVSFPATPGLSRADIVSADFSGTATVTFDETGAPDRAGTVTIQLKSHVYRVAVAAATGKVTVTGS